MSSESARPARVRFLTTAEGGRMTPPVPGVRSQIHLGEFQTSCIVESESGKLEFPLGELVDAQIRVIFAERVGKAFASARAVQLYEGSKLVAEGEFLDLQP
jgi:hypothetical protein